MTTTTTMTAAAAALSGLADDMVDLEGCRYLPGMGQILDGLRAIIVASLEGELSESDTQTLLANLAADGPNITSLIAQAVAVLGDPDTNPALACLPADRQGKTRAFTASYLTDNDSDEAFDRHQLVSEACAAIQGI